MRYEEVLPITPKEAEEAFKSKNPAEVCDALIRVTYYDPDWRWVQAQCLRFARHRNTDIRGLAATCIGHLARIHGVLNIELVLPVLQHLLKDPEVYGRAQDALDDIKTYLGM
ncbi:MAG: hypothetical protein AB1500_04060 [Bacillota bacterium]